LAKLPRGKALPAGGARPIWRIMPRRSPLDDPAIAAHAWTRFKRLMQWMFGGTVLIVLAFMVLLYARDEAVSIHFYIATALGVGFATMLTAALMGLVFLSSGTGHDESVGDAQRDQTRGDGRKR
jgi:hypothetical protein